MKKLTFKVAILLILIPISAYSVIEIQNESKYDQEIAERYQNIAERDRPMNLDCLNEEHMRTLNSDYYNQLFVICSAISISNIGNSQILYEIQGKVDYTSYFEKIVISKIDARPIFISEDSSTVTTSSFHQYYPWSAEFFEDYTTRGLIPVKSDCNSIDMICDNCKSSIYKFQTYNTINASEILDNEDFN